MPELARLMEESVVFDHCISQGISTAPSMTANLTGTYPLDYGGHWYLHDGRPTVAEVLRTHGYLTGAIHSNPNVSRLRNFHKGFDHFDEELVPEGARALMRILPKRFLRTANYAFRLLRREPYLSADGLNTKARAWLGSLEDRKSFLWMQYMNTHGPYLAHEGSSYSRKARSELLWRKAAVANPEAVTAEEHEELWRCYRSEIGYTDAALARLVAWLRESGRLDSTLLVFTSDHGDEFGEHGFYGHRNSPFEELIHVPLVMRFPGAEMAGTRIDDPVRMIDVVPTLLDYVGGWPDPPLTDLMEGVSLMPWIRGEHSGPSAELIITEKVTPKSDQLQVGLRSGGWKYLHDDWRQARELYHLDEDPEERHDLAAERPDKVAEFEAILARRFEDIDKRSADFSPIEVEEDPEVRARLRALGYMD